MTPLCPTHQRLLWLQGRDAKPACTSCLADALVAYHGLQVPLVLSDHEMRSRTQTRVEAEKREARHPDRGIPLNRRYA